MISRGRGWAPHCSPCAAEPRGTAVPLPRFLPPSLPVHGGHPGRDGPAHGAEPVGTTSPASHRCCGREVSQDGPTAAPCRPGGHPLETGHSSGSAARQRGALGDGLGDRWVPGIPPAPAGGREAKPAESTEKQIKLFPFNRNDCLPNYCRNYCPKGEVEGGESSAGRCQESRTQGGMGRVPASAGPFARAPARRPRHCPR